MFALIMPGLQKIWGMRNYFTGTTGVSNCYLVKKRLISFAALMIMLIFVFLFRKAKSLYLSYHLIFSSKLSDTHFFNSTGCPLYQLYVVFDEVGCACLPFFCLQKCPLCYLDERIIYFDLGHSHFLFMSIFESVFKINKKNKKEKKRKE